MFNNHHQPSESGQNLLLMREYQEQGNYQAAIDLGASFSDMHPQIALEIGRNQLRQGYINKAIATFEEVSLDRATCEEKLIITLEKVSSQIYQGVEIPAALERAKSVLDKLELQVNPVARAEAQRVYIRLLMLAGVYRELTSEFVARQRESLPEIADTLEAAGYINESLAARFSYAEYKQDLEGSLSALETVARIAISQNHLEVAGEAYLRRAEKFLVGGGSEEEIQANLDRASQYYTQKQHLHGCIDVKRVTARLAIERELANPEIMRPCLDAYRQIDLPKNTVSVLMDISQLALENGNVLESANYRQEMFELANQIGIHLIYSNFILTQVDLLTRNGNYAEAIDVAQAGLTSNLPRFLVGSYQQLLATAYSFVGNLDAALKQGKKAYFLFKKLKATDSTSLAALQLASYLDSTRQDRNWSRAEKLLTNWIERDEIAGRIAEALNKRELLIQILLNKFYYSPQYRGNLSLLNCATEIIEGFERLLAQIVRNRERIRRFGSLCQLKGMMSQAHDDTSGVEQAWKEALEAYESSGMEMEAANCHYIIGALRLNQANIELLPHFGEAESNFRAALDYYEQAFMRSQGADTCFMLARLYVNAFRRINLDFRNQMIDATLNYLSQGEANYDAMRQEFATGTISESQSAKQTLIEKSARLYELALEILVLDRLDSQQLWQWTQKSKARALGDAMGSGLVPLARTIDMLEQYPDAYQLVIQERDIAQRLSRASAEEKLVLKREREQIYRQMQQNAHLAEYLKLRTGVNITEDYLDGFLEQEQSTCVCIDWIAVGKSLWLIVKRPNSLVQYYSLDIRLQQIEAFYQRYFGSPAQLRSLLIDTPEFLAELNPLIAPLEDCTAENELLVFAPTKLLHLIPLHALSINGQTLLERNAIAYCPSLGILRYCIARRKTDSINNSIALFGDPNSDRPNARESVQYLANLYDTTPLMGEQITKETFVAKLTERDIIHFQGHAQHNSNEPLRSYLLLGREKLTAQEILNIRNLNAQQIILAACQSGVNQLKTGDEPLGLIPAFLISGANSVLATLWKVPDSSTSLFMKTYHNFLIQSNWQMNKAEALRQTVLTLKQEPQYSAPYHWAAFTLNGDWR